jgi:hypothetical protein
MESGSPLTRFRGKCPSKWICVFRVYIFSPSLVDSSMKILHQKAFESALRTKVTVYRRHDKEKERETSSFAEFLSMVDACSGKCPRCACTILFEDYKPYCVYQYSFDRLDNSKGHVVENMEIVCWNCNSVDSKVGLVPQYRCRLKRACTNGCHAEEAGLQEHIKQLEEMYEASPWCYKCGRRELEHQMSKSGCKPHRYTDVMNSQCK